MLKALKQSNSREPDLMSRIVKEGASEVVELFVADVATRYDLDPEQSAQLEAYAVDQLINFFAEVPEHDTAACTLASLSLIHTNISCKAFDLLRK